MIDTDKYRDTKHKTVNPNRANSIVPLIINSTSADSRRTRRKQIRQSCPYPEYSLRHWRQSSGTEDDRFRQRERSMQAWLLVLSPRISPMWICPNFKVVFYWALILPLASIAGGMSYFVCIIIFQPQPKEVFMHGMFISPKSQRKSSFFYGAYAILQRFAWVVPHPTLCEQFGIVLTSFIK